MTKTAIEWTEESWNPIVGCSVLSPGCTNCYAMAMAARIEASNAALVAAGKPTLAPHYDGTTRIVNGHAVWTGKLGVSEKTLLAPLKRKKPTTYFVNSMGDLFHENCPDADIDRVFAVMALTPQHTYQVLTKRAARMWEYNIALMAGRRSVINAAKELRGSIIGAITARESLVEDQPVRLRPLPNVWLGVSTERQQEADERTPLLLQTPAAVRFISAEPLLGPINLKRWMPSGKWGTFKGAPVYHQTYFMTKCEHCGWFGSSELCHECGDDADVVCPSCNKIFICDEVDAKLHWVIAGGESGPDSRPMHPDWARSLRDQCAAADVPFFFKQWGTFVPNFHLEGRLGRGIIAGPTDTGSYVAGMGDDKPAIMLSRVGKKAAGKLLDGRIHQAMPGKFASTAIGE